MCSVVGFWAEMNEFYRFHYQLNVIMGFGRNFVHLHRLEIDLFCTINIKILAVFHTLDDSVGTHLLSCSIAGSMVNATVWPVIWPIPVTPVCIHRRCYQQGKQQSWPQCGSHLVLMDGSLIQPVPVWLKKCNYTSNERLFIPLNGNILLHLNLYNVVTSFWCDHWVLKLPSGV